MFPVLFATRECDSNLFHHMKSQSEKNKFKTKAGRLTPYALACGYIEEKEKQGVRLQLWHEGGPYYQVSAFDHAKGKRIFWDSLLQQLL